MQIKITIADSLVRTPDDPSPVPLVAMEYRDRRSTTVQEALDVAWRICNAAPHLLDERQARLRDVWEGRSGGLGLSVGDVVEVDGARFRCEREGWTGL